MACHCGMRLCYGGGMDQAYELRVQSALHLSLPLCFSYAIERARKKSPSSLLEFHSTSMLGVILHAFYERALPGKILKLFQNGLCVVSLCSIVDVMAWMVIVGTKSPPPYPPSYPLPPVPPPRTPPGTPR